LPIVATTMVPSSQSANSAFVPSPIEQLNQTS
jgi:hypothetical protein